MQNWTTFMNISLPYTNIYFNTCFTICHHLSIFVTICHPLLPFGTIWHPLTTNFATNQYLLRCGSLFCHSRYLPWYLPLFTNFTRFTPIKHLMKRSCLTYFSLISLTYFSLSLMVGEQLIFISYCSLILIPHIRGDCRFLKLFILISILHVEIHQGITCSLNATDEPPILPTPHSPLPTKTTLILLMNLQLQTSQRFKQRNREN